MMRMQSPPDFGNLVPVYSLAQPTFGVGSFQKGELCFIIIHIS